MIYFGSLVVKSCLWACVLMCSPQEPEQAATDSPPPLFGERTEDQVLQLLANAPPGDDDGTRAGLKVFVAERFSTGHQLAFLIASCACLCLLVPGAFLLVSSIQGSALSPERVTRYAVTLAVLSLAWVMFVYSLAFSRNVHSYDIQQREVQILDRDTAPGNLFIGDLNHWQMQGLLPEWGGGVVRHPQRRAGDSFPHSIFMLFQTMFFLQAIAPLLAITWPKLDLWAAFPLWLLWSIVVYAPLCYWTRGGGWLADCVDAGGTVPMHVAIGFTALGLSYMGRTTSALPKLQLDRASFYTGSVVYLGGVLLLAGCRSVLSASWPTFDLMNGFLGGVSGLLIWVLVARRSRFVNEQQWPLGFVAGMATLASGSASMPPTSAIIAGAIGTFACCMILCARQREASVYWLLFAVFGVTGVVGLALTGVLSSPEIAGADLAGKPIVGIIAGGNELLRVQLLTGAIAATLAFTAGLMLPQVALAIGWVLEKSLSNAGTSKVSSDTEATLNV